MINLASMALTIMALGLLSMGSIWSVPAFIAAFAGWGLADRLSFDVEVLGGLFILLIGCAVAYSIVRSAFLFLFG